MSSILKADVVVVGTGIAGLSAAIRAGELGLNVILVTRESDPHECNSKYAQGGIIYSTPDDQKLVADIDKASSKTADLKIAEILSSKSDSILKDLLIDKANVPFARNDNGELLLTMEGAHSYPRILFVGDYSGKAIIDSLFEYLQKSAKGITLLKNHTAIDLALGSEGQVAGIHLFDNSENEVITINSSAVILATGGLGSLYLHNSNTDGARGDGHGMAIRANARLNNMEFIQFHPTTFFDPNSHQRFLISEAVRGEGAILRNSKGERFMERYHPDLELASRDIVSKSIVDEIESTGHPCVYLDVKHFETEWFKNRFPTIFAHCERLGVDLKGKGIPVVPSAHYSCGGIDVNEYAETSVRGLYAIGEASCTGLHGANRLASTALLEGLTFGHIAAEHIAESLLEKCTISSIHFSGNNESDITQNNITWARLKTLMWQKVGIVRNRAQLLEASEELSLLREEVERRLAGESLNDGLLGLRGGIQASMEIVKASLNNDKSVGCFHINK